MSERPSRVVFLHTAGMVLDSFRSRVKEEFPGLEVSHVLNESLLQDLLRGEPSNEVFERMSQQLTLVEDSGADLVVVTCSSTSPGVDIARERLGIPVLKIDDPMAELAVTSGTVIGLVCTASSTLEASSELLRAHARAAAREIELKPILLSDAYEALFAGDRDKHNRIVLDAAAELATSVDLIVLAQASLAPLQQQLAGLVDVPVLSSPDLLFAELHKLVDEPA